MSEEPMFYVLRVDEDERRNCYSVFRDGSAAGWIADFAFQQDAEQYAQARNLGERSGQLELVIS